MKYQLLISHRGNTNGANTDRENTTIAVNEAINKGYDCEIDLWAVENDIFLGHDFPQYKIEYSFLEDFKNNLWIHCKNFESLVYMQNYGNNFNYFWHEIDKFTITSKGYIWTFPGNRYYKNSVIVNLDENLILDTDCYGICSDFVSHY